MPYLEVDVFYAAIEFQKSIALDVSIIQFENSFFPFKSSMRSLLNLGAAIMTAASKYRVD